MSASIPTVVLGASGYVGAELLRLLSGHPTFSLAAAVSNSHAGKPVGELITPLGHRYPDQQFVAIDAALDAVPDGAPLALFAAAPHGASAAAVATVLSNAAGKSLDVHAVDLSADFRFADAGDFEGVYGMPHAAPELLSEFACALPEHGLSGGTRHRGHPGCFTTAALLAAVPALAAGIVEADLFVTGITGSTGSGRSPGAGTHHPDRHGNLTAYQSLHHRHAPEIEALAGTAAGRSVRVHFVPHSGPFARGIYLTLQARLSDPLSTTDALAVYRDYYAGATFVHAGSDSPRLKDVVTSNFARLGVATNGRSLAVHCAIDNLVKGAAGGAMQWMNRLWSLPDPTGLDAPAPGWN